MKGMVDRYLVYLYSRILLGLRFKCVLGLICILVDSNLTQAQNVPVSFPIVNDYLRREQVLGNLEPEVSFNIRPFLMERSFPDFQHPYLMDTTDGYKEVRKSSLKLGGEFKITLLPVQLTSIFNSNHPYGWGNGAVLPARGLQTLWSAGVHLKLGPLSIQAYPQYHYVQNLAFEEYPADAPSQFFARWRRGVNGVDNPVRHGQTPISRLLPGNSHVKVNVGSFAFGASTENIWWGPGQFNSLLISDNAQGFPHLTLHSTKPAKTFLGHFEGQYFVGRLDGSGLTHFSDGAFPTISTPVDMDTWRYFTGLSVSYSPKWFSGLSLGLSRTFQIYRSDMGDNFRAYFPLLAPLPKEGEGVIENIEMREDQNISVYLRWAIPQAKSEFYIEYIRNDHALNWRDLIINPEHSRGFLLGFSKYVDIGKSHLFGLRAEMTQTQNSINNNLRWSGINNGLGLFDNNQVSHGLTQRGQIIGSGAGNSGNLYLVELSLVKNFQKIALTLDRLARDQNFYHLANSNNIPVNPWVDLGLGGAVEDRLGNILLTVQVKTIQMHNKHFFRSEPSLMPSQKDWNFHSNFKIAYIF
jgi:hypothetical protein